ncbi:MAG: triphosphoribosyl-dephospho-CoA synthase [Methylotenera sp.]|nr:triphosphoribosyl-dephospho-CoA synthase [Methylotenera sp.]
MAIKITPHLIANAYHTACMAELQALKPGNVHMFADGHGMTIDDFIRSADATVAVMSQPDVTVGERVLYSVSATQKAVGQNTNLGILLLCAPLIQAALCTEDRQSFVNNLNKVLKQLTIQDAQHVAKAIVLANPAGLGESSQYDVRGKIEVTLFELMRTAQNKDRIAWQYANNFKDILSFGLTRYAEALAKWNNRAWATTAVYLGFLSQQCDSHVIRKHGSSLAMQVMREAQAIELIYMAADNVKLVQQKLLGWDNSLKKRHINPGTSADLTVATLLLHEVLN